MKDIWKIKPIRINPIRIHFNFDTDRDNVKDRDDCEWWNPKKQHITPNQATRERLKKVPIYVTDEPVYQRRKEDLYRIESEAPGSFKGVHHISSPEAKKYAPTTTREVYGMIKEYPSVLGEIERTKPKQIIYSTAIPPTDTVGLEYKKRIIVRSPNIYSGSLEEIELPEKKSEFEREYTREKYVRQLPFEKDTDKQLFEKERRSLADTTFHELEHVKQERVLGMGKMDIQQKTFPYSEIPFEKEARKESLEQLQKYEPSQQPTGKQITKILDLD